MLFFDIIAYFVFLYPLYMSIIWMIGGIVFSLRRESGECPELSYYPLFSIIIPAHNEGDIIEETILRLKNLDYPRYEIIVVNDGSTDGTSYILDRLVSLNSKWLRVVHVHPNSGKSKALNSGIAVSKAEFILTIDADCIIAEDTLKWMAWHLISYPRVGAVTGNPRVRNRTTLLGKIQVGEYSTIIGLIKRTQRVLGKILTVSGVMAAYRKSAILACGLFDSDTVTEDIDITWKLQKQFWDIRYEPRALAWVLVPETLRGLWWQRIRWAQGGIEVLKKHFDVWYRLKYRRFWPIYLEYLAGVLWSFSFLLLVISWLLISAINYSIFFIHTYFPTIIPVESNIAFYHNPIYPQWYGSILGITCLIQFFTSFIIDYKYEKKLFGKYYFWVIWYPVIYWFLCSLTVIKGTYNTIFKRKGVSVKWLSPDRGFHTLK